MSYHESRWPEITKLAQSLLYPTILLAGLLGTFTLLDKKIPDAPSAATVKTAPLVGRSDARQTRMPPAFNDNRSVPNSSDSSGMLVLAAIETYARKPENSLRVSIPGAELADNVIEPLAKSGLITAETGKALLIKAMDGGTTLVTDYFHQKWQARTQKEGPSSTVLPTIICSPVFNAGPPIAIPRAVHKSTVASKLSQAKSPVCPAPRLREIEPTKR